MKYKNVTVTRIGAPDMLQVVEHDLIPPPELM